MKRLPLELRLNDSICLVNYCNAFDPKISYIQRDKNPQNLREEFKMVVHIENNRRASRKVGRRDDIKILKNPKKEDNNSTEKGSSLEDKIAR